MGENDEAAVNFEIDGEMVEGEQPSITAEAEREARSVLQAIAEDGGDATPSRQETRHESADARSDIFAWGSGDVDNDVDEAGLHEDWHDCWATTWQQVAATSRVTSPGEAAKGSWRLTMIVLGTHGTIAVATTAWRPWR